MAEKSVWHCCYALRNTTNGEDSTPPEGGPPRRMRGGNQMSGEMSRELARQAQARAAAAVAQTAQTAQASRGGQTPQSPTPRMPSWNDSLLADAMSQTSMSSQSRDRHSYYGQRGSASSSDSTYGSQSGNSRRSLVTGESAHPPRTSSRAPPSQPPESTAADETNRRILHELDRVLFSRMDESVAQTCRAQLENKPAVVQWVYRRLAVLQSRSSAPNPDEGRLFRDSPLVWLVGVLADATNSLLGVTAQPGPAANDLLRASAQPRPAVNDLLRLSAQPRRIVEEDDYGEEESEDDHGEEESEDDDEA